MIVPVFDITSDQRYYNMVILKAEGILPQKIDESFGDWVFIKSSFIKSAKVVHLIYNSNIPYHRGEQQIYYAKNNKSLNSFNIFKPKKFLYDCLLISIESSGLICILAPFTELLEKLRKAFIQHYRIDVKYLSLNMLEMVKVLITNELVTEDLTIKTTGLGVSKRSSGDISNIIIKGNKPLSTDIGELVLGLLYKADNMHESIWFPSNSRIKCVIGRTDSILRVNLSLNADKYGNFKLYLQRGCLNILTLLSFLEYILTKNYYRLVITSPTLRSPEND